MVITQSESKNSGDFECQMSCRRSSWADDRLTNHVKVPTIYMVPSWVRFEIKYGRK